MFADLASLLSDITHDTPRVPAAAPPAASAPLEPCGCRCKSPGAETSCPCFAAGKKAAEASAPPPPVLKVVQVPPTMPQPAALPAPKPVVWQLYCSGEGKVFYHADKGYLERWVTERNAACRATAQSYQQAQQPIMFLQSAPGYGFQTGGFSSGGCSSGRCGR